jgi:hypothetical protein
LDIQEFYDSDPRRRGAVERTFGTEWNLTDDPGHRWDLFWNAGTGELYLMQKPVASPWVGWLVEDTKDDMRALAAFEHRIVGEFRHLLHPRQVFAKTGDDPGDRYKDALTEELTIEVLGVFPAEEEVDRLLGDWQAKVDQPDSLNWLKGQLTLPEVPASDP